MTDRGSPYRLSRCISCLQHWFLRNHLLLNGRKSDSIIIGTAQRHARAPQPTHLRVAESCVAVSDSLKLLGVTLDHTMSFNKHLSTVVRACNFHLSALRHIRSLVSDTVGQQIDCSIVGSRLDYCNSLLVNCSNRNLDKLQHVQDNLASYVAVGLWYTVFFHFFYSNTVTCLATNLWRYLGLYARVYNCKSLIWQLWTLCAFHKRSELYCGL